MTKINLKYMALVIIYSLLFFLVKKDATAYIAIALTLIAVLPKWRLQIIALTTISFQLLPEKLIFYHSYKSLLSLTSDASISELSHLSWLTGVIAVAVMWILIELRGLLITCPRVKRPFLFGLTAVLVIFFALAWWVHIGSEGSWLRMTVIWVVMALSKYLWFFAYDLQSRPLPSTEPTWSRSAYYSQFWTFNLISPTIPKGESYWKKFSVQGDHELFKLRLRAIYLLAWGALLKIVFSFMSRWIYKDQTLWDFKFWTVNQMLTRIQNGDEVSTWQAILFSLIDNSFNLANIVYWGHIAVSVIWFCGYQVPKNTDSPYLSINPLDFFARINFYLKEIVFQLFYFPCFLFLKGWPLVLRVFISLFYAVSVGKFLVNYTKRASLIMDLGIVESLHQHASYFLYCVLMTLCLFPFLIGGLDSKKQPPISTAGKVARAALIFVGYTAIRMFDTIHLNDVSISWKLFLLFFGARL